MHERKVMFRINPNIEINVINLSLSALMLQPLASFRRKPESRIPGENRDPVFKMVPGFRRDDVWTPAFAGVTVWATKFPLS